jgi:1-deoxy-D-xylulose-5-phosphate synthase
MPLLEHINEPADLRDLSPTQLDALAQEIRAFLVRHVAETGGHLGPNLGVVELTLALRPARPARPPCVHGSSSAPVPRG